MEWIQTFIELVLHVDKHLDSLITQFGVWFYVLMFLVIFCETGLVVTPFLPGDSLLFALGAFAARGSLSLAPLLLLLPIAAILGDMVNYWCGVWLGPKLFRGDKIRFLKKEHLDRTHTFYEKYGAKTIVLARFVPIVRTFAPFVAGMGRMSYAKFTLYNVVGALLWVGLFVPAGYFFADHPLVRKNFTLVMLAIIVISVLPAVFEFLRERAKNRNASASTP